MKGVARDIRLGTGLALITGAGAWLLARYGFGHLYYLAVLLPAAMTSMLLVAWFIHLRDDGFFGGAKQEQAKQLPAFDDAGHARFQVRFNEGILERAAPTAEGPPARTAREVGRALLWGSAELGLASVALYRWAGVGAHLFR